MEALLNARAEVTDAALAAIAPMPTASLPVLMDDAFAQRLTDADLMRIDSIGVISDTHGLLRPEALTMLEGCGLILHLGDVGARDEDAALLERLAELAPTLAVRGNVDTALWAEALPTTLDLTVNGWRLHLVHRLAEFDPATPCHAVLHGHSHKPRNEWQDGRLLFNPGAAGKRRFRLPITLGKLWGDERGLRGAIQHLPL